MNILFHTFHISTFKVVVQLKVNIIKLIASNSGKNRNATLYDQVIAATPVQPASTAFKVTPMALDIALPAGDIISCM